MLNDLTLVINAGGQSRRMGQPKALLPTPTGAPLLVHVLRRLAPLAPAHTIVVANDPAIAALPALPPGTRCLADAYPGTGTLGGIATGLGAASGWTAVAACDLPFVQVTVFAYLCVIAAEQEHGGDRWDAVVPVVGGYEEPLHALYHARCLPAIAARLAAGARRVISFMPDVRTRYVDEAELRAIDPQLSSFVNVNTPEEWAAVQALLAAGRE
jgi:molybdopterin-guanine dinucleotide biosynthesis protein A